MSFTGLGIEDAVPDANTVWLLRARLKVRELTAELFVQFGEYLRQVGYQGRGGQMVDAKLVPVPKQHNRSLENQATKRGETPEQQQPKKLMQKDCEARWIRSTARVTTATRTPWEKTENTS
ncbi:hypothetical protein KR51_00001330 [Rubidibacter lacunae KORDI 51-2]|uniref:Transposase n=1 Tax=Rubidibacter lacunae KORDI 51-2 TaxID=582515 RepID=U5DF01_9CHRO|nr:IS5 family transposase [Rubidibacter lacunae]ERN43073.1 hypothetical protein KR51_00001330 [Rubidibacter lacunae KORDI 51-2]